MSLYNIIEEQLKSKENYNGDYMSKKCPECGDEVPNQAHYCGNCGYDFFQNKDSKQAISNNVGAIFENGKLLMVIIAIVIIVAAGVFVAMGLGGNNQASDDNQHEVDLTITEVNGYDGSSSPKSYSLYTYAIFNKVPSNLNGYNVKTTYFDENDTEIGHETETLSNVYYDTDYALSFGFYTTYKKPNPHHVTVEIIKDGKTIDSFTANVDQGKIEFLN